MSITLKVKTVNTFTLVVSNEFLAQVVSERAQARALSAEKVESLKGHQRYVIDVLRSERTDEEVVKVVFKDSLIEVAKEQAREVNEEGVRMKGHQVVVSFEDDSVVKRACDCGACFECKVARGGAE
ncbi:hypothetical protein [Pseudomonas phage Waldo5]|uniref:Uncharacterized protein n=1 Tax=Pseudomonas phage Waldo5 TaxID=2762290 RepID=A0A7G8LJP1_9CAUD|nr:hypothetical protein [Pseudomonas phage Waldo5]